MGTAGNKGLVLELQRSCMNGYFPGDTFAGLLHVAPERNESVGFDADYHLEEITTEFKGIERVDTSWVSKEYRKNVKQLNKDSRRVQRCVVEGALRAGARGNFGEDACRVFLIRFSIPEWIPPSFSGVVARYSYQLDISVKFAIAGPDNRSNGHTVSLRESIHVWPPASPDPCLLGDASVFAQTETTATFLDTFGDDIEIKCWEVGFGTTIDDLVENVEMLQQESLSTPYSPAYQGERLSRTASLDTRPNLSPGDVLKKRLFDKYQDTTSAVDRRDMVVHILPEPTENAEIVRQESGSKSPLINPKSEQRQRYFDGLPESSSSFRLRIEDIVFARIHLHSSGEQEPLCPGKSVVGTIEFTESPDVVRCVKYAVALEIEEQIENEWISKGKSAALGGRLHQTVEESVHISPDTVSTCFYVTLPPNATPDFRSDLMSLQWGLRFYFYMTIRNQKSIKTLEWKIPLKIRPPCSSFV